MFRVYGLGFRVHLELRRIRSIHRDDREVLEEPCLRLKVSKELALNLKTSLS